MAISDQLTLLNNTKTAIRTAINNKGGSVGASDTFASYATAIDNLPSGGSGNPLLESIDVSDFTGTTFNRATSYITDVTIPSGVTTIGDYAFRYFSKLSSITIPSSVTSIGQYALGDCTSLTDVTIPNNVTSIAGNALNGCTGLTSLTIGNSVRTIGSGAFNDCRSLTSISIPNSVTSIGTNAFNNCSSIATVNADSLESWCSIDFDISYTTGTNPISLPNTNRPTLYVNGSAITGNLIIPNTLTSISSGCFYNYSKITSVSIPDTITSIGDFAFQKSGISGEVTLPASITSLGLYALGECTGITALVVLATTPPTLGYSALYTGVNYPIYVPAASVDAYKAASDWRTYASRIYPITQVATVDGNPVHNYDLGMTSTDTITSENMAKMPAGASVEFAEGLTNIAAGEINYQEVILPSTFTGFGDSDMIGSNVTTITSNAVTPPSAFRNQLGGSGLTAIYVPASAVDTYKAHAAWGTFSSIIQAIPSPLMAEITQSDNSVYDIPYDGVGVLDENNVPFEDALVEATDIHITSYATAIGQPFELDGAYYGVFEGDGATNTLETVTIDEGLTAIPNQAFASNVGLTTVTLPSTITSIGDYAFGMSDGSGVLGVMSFTIHATTPPTLGTDAVGVQQGRLHGKFYVPAASVDIYKAAPGWSTWASDIEAIPSE